jgi:hypothetical protein
MVLHRIRVGLVRRIVLTVALSITTSFGVLASLPTTAAQSVPYKVNFQGRLTDNNGNILPDGSYNIKFRLFDAPSAGTNKFEEDRVFAAADNRVSIQNGLFNIQFGDITAITPALFSGAFTLYLEVELPTPASSTCASNGCAVFTEGAMTPRQSMASSPYAISADTLDGIDSSGFAQLNTSNTGSLTLTAALQSATATFTGASALTLGSTTNAAGIVFNDGTSNNRAVTLSAPALTGSYGLSLPTTAPNPSQCLQSGASTASQLIFGSCSGGITSLQTAYNSSTNPEIVAGTSATSGLTIRDNATPIGANLLEVQNNTGATTYFGVTSSGISVTGTATTSVSFTGPLFDTTTAGTLSVGTSTASAITLGKVAVSVSAPGGITTSNGTINAGTGTITGGVGTYSTSLLSALHDIASAGTLNIGTTNATAITLGKFGVTTSTSGAVAVNSGTNVPTTDQITIDNTASTGVTTAGANGLNVHYKGGAAAIEAAGMRVDYTSGTTSGGIWEGLRIVENSASATGVTSYGLKLEGISGTGSNVAIKIGSGWDAGLEMAAGSADPATPAAGTIDVFARTVAGRSLLRQKGPSGVSFSYQPGLFEQALLYQSPGSGTAVGNNLGITVLGGQIVTSGNLTSGVSEVFGSYTNFATATNNTTGVGMYETLASHYRGSATNSSNGFFYVTRIALPDALGLTNARIFAGLTDAAVVTTMGASDTPAGNYAGFRLSTTALDTSWKFVSRDGTTAATPIATAASTQNHVYDLYMYSPTYTSAASISTMYWRVDDLTTGTTTEGSSTTNLPTATVGLHLNSVVTPTITGTAHNLRVLKTYVEADR